MDHEITENQLNLRRFFFLPNYAALICGSLVVFEMMAFVSCYMPRVFDWLRKQWAKQFDSARNPSQPQPSLVQPSKSQSFTPLLVEFNHEVGQSVPDEPKEPKHYSFSRHQNLTQRHRLYAYSFIFYYLMYHAWLHFLIDVSVAGGLMNAGTGLAFEMWSLGIVFELLTHFLTVLAKCIICFGQRQQHPSVLLMPSFLPWVGNFVHIYKDHTAQGLCFAVGHCKTGLLQWVGISLGYSSIFSTIYPLFFLVRTEECREGLRQAHWTVQEAGPPAIGSPKFTTLLAWQQMYVSWLVGMCTKEKAVRALHGEVPHTVLHVLFAFFFGGSAFIAFAIIVSAVKILMIPVLRESVIAPAVKKYGCSKFTARKYLVNGGDPEVIAAMAEKMQWIDILGEFFDQAAATFNLNFAKEALSPADLSIFYPTLRSDQPETLSVRSSLLIKQGRKGGDELYPGMAGVTAMHYKIGITCDNARYNVGLGCYVGQHMETRFCFHPGMDGGQFRIEGEGGHGNMDIGFKPKPFNLPGDDPKMARFPEFTIMLDAKTGRHSVTITDSSGLIMHKSEWESPDLWKDGDSSPPFGIYAGDVGGNGYVYYQNFSVEPIERK